jgi:hypothetical protein
MWQVINGECDKPKFSATMWLLSLLGGVNDNLNDVWCYCIRSGSWPPSLAGHSEIIYCMNTLASKILRCKDASVVEECLLKSLTRVM